MPSRRPPTSAVCLTRSASPQWGRRGWLTPWPPTSAATSACRALGDRSTPPLRRKQQSSGHPPRCSPRRRGVVGRSSQPRRPRGPPSGQGVRSVRPERRRARDKPIYRFVPGASGTPGASAAGHDYRYPGLRRVVLFPGVSTRGSRRGPERGGSVPARWSKRTLLASALFRRRFRRTRSSCDSGLNGGRAVVATGVWPLRQCDRDAVHAADGSTLVVA